MTAVESDKNVLSGLPLRQFLTSVCVIQFSFLFLGWKEDLPAPGDLVLEASNVDKAQKCVDFRMSKAMEEKAQRDWVRSFRCHHGCM